VTENLRKLNDELEIGKKINQKRKQAKLDMKSLQATDGYYRKRKIPFENK
jgi:hypothetical protein